MGCRFPVALAISLILGMGANTAFGQKPKKQKDDVNQIGDRKVATCINFYSIEKELALGNQLAAEVRKQAKIVEDPLLSEYVNRLGQNLVRNSDAKVPFQFHLIENDAPNAFALPGGYIFVNTGLLKIASEEDEFAAVMAHEIGHVAARHMTCQATKSQIAGIASIPASILLGGWGGYAARQGAGLVVPAALLRFTRKEETEADYLGVQYLWAAGYDPTGAVTIFEKIESLSHKNPGLVDRMLSSHPMDGDRIRHTEEEIGRILPSRAEYVVTTSEYTAIRDRFLNRAPAPPAPAR